MERPEADPASVSAWPWSPSYPPPQKGTDGFFGFYALLEVHSTARLDTVHRVYRILALRFHPDNATTGNASGSSGKYLIRKQCWRGSLRSARSETATAMSNACNNPMPQAWRSQNAKSCSASPANISNLSFGSCASRVGHRPSDHHRQSVLHAEEPRLIVVVRTHKIALERHRQHLVAQSKRTTFKTQNVDRMR